ncbi:hypothetical protein N657DRAFT_464312 [Parathielavia appendiculata]|uniref:protein disulfide-isomerase n=1 Tax=Parathielavia appendiculata TaxID=2587402 RepID=A0AAN6Z3F2_9PEZI|nr:hypothetical protein N657DRAFT_464312 [Parathielavia appendiculata]
MARRCAMALFLLGAKAVSAWDHVSSGELKMVVEMGDPVLVAFIKPDGPASAALEQEWLSAAASGAKHKQQLLSVDCSASEVDCDIQENIEFPSIFVLQRDKPIAQYRGTKRAAAMLHFLSRRTRPVVTEGLDGDQLAGFKTADETVFVAYLDQSDRDSAAVFGEVAMRYRDEFSFGTVVDPEVAGSQGLEAPAVVCYKLVDGDTVTLKEVQGFDELDNWVKEASRPVISELTVLNWQRLLDRGWPMVYLFGSTEAQRQQLRKSLYKFARSYYDSLTSVMVDPNEFPDLMGRLGLEPSVFPAGAVHQLSKDRIYPYSKGWSFSSDALQRWALDVYQGRIKPWTPPGVTTTFEDLGPTRAAMRKVSMASIPGVKIKIAGHDEL